MPGRLSTSSKQSMDLIINKLNLNFSIVSILLSFEIFLTMLMLLLDSFVAELYSGKN